jgi:UTP--glucose-1-phosphate uridylyltransferase
VKGSSPRHQRCPSTVYAYLYEGRRHDTGDKLGFLKATVEFALKREDLGGELREYLKELTL